MLSKRFPYDFITTVSPGFTVDHGSAFRCRHVFYHPPDSDSGTVFSLCEDTFGSGDDWRCKTSSETHFGVTKLSLLRQIIL